MTFNQQNTLPIIIVFFALLFTKPVIDNNTITLEGSVKNTTDSYLILRDNYYNAIDTLTIKNNRFKNALELKTGYYFLSYAEQNAHLYIESGQHIKMNFDAYVYVSSIKYEGQNTVNNNYLADKDRLTQTLPDKQKFYSFYAALNEDQFLKQTDSFYNAYLKLFEQHKNLDTNFKSIESNALKIDNTIRLYLYEAHKRIVDNNPNFKVSGSFPNPFNNIDLNAPKLLSRQGNTFKFSRQCVRFLYSISRTVG